MHTSQQQASQWTQFIFQPKDTVEARCIRRADKKPLSWHFLAEDFPNQWERMRKLNQEGFDIYCGINARSTPTGTTDEHVALSRVVVADIEKITIEQALERVSQTDLLDPNLVMSSGHGCHLYFRLQEPITDMNAWRGLQAKLAALLDGDPVIKDPSRIMRVPGFKNWKPPEADAILHSVTDGSITLVQLEQALTPKNPIILAAPVAQLKGATSSGLLVKGGVISTIDRAQAYLKKIPEAIEGQGGDKQTYRVAFLLVHGFNLTQEQAWPLMMEYSSRCQPPWTEREILHKLKSADEFQGQRGWLLGKDRPSFINASNFKGSNQTSEVSSEAPAAQELPHSEQIERCMVSAALQDRDALAEVMGIVPQADMLYHPGPRAAYRAGLEMNQAGRGIDLNLLSDHLQRMGNLEEAGGQSALADLYNATRTFDLAGDYARQVRELWLLRQMACIGSEMTEAALQEPDAKELLSDYEQKLFALSEAGDDGNPVTSVQVSHAVMDSIDRYGRGEKLGLSFGFSSVDKIFCGMVPKSLTVLAGRPGGGKSKFAGNVMVNIAKEGKPVIIYSLEMSNEEIGIRIACALAGVDHFKVVHHRHDNPLLTPSESRKLNEACDKLGTLPIYWQDKPGLRPLELRASLRRMKRRHGIELAVIDHMLLMQPDKKTHKSRNDEVGEISRMLKLAAKEVGIPILALCQMNRGVEGRADDTPRLSDLRDSGNIEQDADNVLFLHKPRDPQEVTIYDTVELHIAKQRNGPPGKVSLIDRKQYYRFEDCPNPIRFGGP